MVPHRSPTDTSRQEHSHPHPPATFPSNAFSSDSLQFQSLPIHRILTEVGSNPCNQNVPTSKPKYCHIDYYRLLQILGIIMTPHQSPTNTSRWLHSRRHPMLTEVPQAMPFPLLTALLSPCHLLPFWFWWRFFYLWFWEKIGKQKCEDQNLPHVTSHLKR